MAGANSIGESVSCARGPHGLYAMSENSGGFVPHMRVAIS